MSTNKKGDESGFLTGGKYITSKNFTPWLLLLGIVCLLVGIVFLHLMFNPPYLGYLLYGYFISWLKNRSVYLYISAFFLLASVASFTLAVIYEKHLKVKKGSGGKF